MKVNTTHPPGGQVVGRLTIAERVLSSYREVVEGSNPLRCGFLAGGSSVVGFSQKDLVAFALTPGDLSGRSWRWDVALAFPEAFALTPGDLSGRSWRWDVALAFPED
ncbi:uncharacterized protein J3R85_017787 [Psidium guajava]|nr:uncharacterized protein J3R85_017787 [Psidium guajava]